MHRIHPGKGLYFSKDHLSCSLADWSTCKREGKDGLAGCDTFIPIAGIRTTNLGKWVFTGILSLILWTQINYKDYLLRNNSR